MLQFFFDTNADQQTKKGIFASGQMKRTSVKKIIGCYSLHCLMSIKFF